MVCPYCNTRNIPNSAVCSHCGVLLGAHKPSERAPKRKVRRNSTVPLLAAVIGAIIGALVGYFLAGHLPLDRTTAIAILGGVLGAILFYAIFAAKSLYYSFVYRTKHTALQVRIKNALAAAENRYENEMKKQDGGYQGRLNLAVAHLLQDELEKSVQEFQQAHQQGAADPKFYNNAGVALARRGSLTQSVEMFERAAKDNGESLPPHSNLAHVFVYSTGAGEDSAERAIREIQQTIALDGKNPIHYGRLGLILCRAQRHEEAVKHFQRALELASGSRAAEADAHVNLGIAHFLNGDAQEAANEFQTARRLDPGHGPALCNQGILQLVEGRSKDALERLQTAAQLDPNSAQIHCSLGYALCRLQAINDGIRAFRESLLHDLNLFEAHYNLGKVYTDEHLPDIAERHLGRALQLNPCSWEAQVAMGVVKAQLGQIAQAAEYFQKASHLSHNQPLILTNLGLCLTQMGEFTEGERCFRQASRIDTKNPEIYAHLGWYSLRRTHVSQAADELHEALSLDEKLAEAHNNYGLCKYELAQYELALPHFKRALNLKPELAPVHYQLGCTYAHLNQMDQAMKEWEQNAKLEPGNPDCYANLGITYYRKGALDQAVTEFRRVIVIRQSRMEDYSNLGLTYAKQGMTLRAASRNPQDAKAKEAVEKHKQAIDMFDRALALDPYNVMLHSNRGLACFFANRPEDAMEEWARVTKLDPNYARRRGKKQQSEFDDSAVGFVPMVSDERALSIPPKAADYLYRFMPGYSTDEWEMMIDDPALAALPELTRQSRYLERNLHALKA